MLYQHFSIRVIIRIVLLIGNVLLLAWIFGDIRLFFNQIILVLILIGQVAELIYFVNHTNRELSRLFLSIRHSDFTVNFKKSSMGKSFSELESSFTEIITAYRQVKIEKEAQYQFLQMLVRQIHIGIISLQHDEIILINPTAEKLLGVDGIKNWKLIQRFQPAFANEIELLGENGRKLTELKSGNENKVLAIDVSSTLLLDAPYRLITIQDINSEIEQKEIEAWHKLIRILTHEIMNSVTPISSLTETMQGMLTDRDGRQKELIQAETVSDIRFSLNTIQKRSEGLLDFVENYRKLTRLPKPVLQEVNAREFLIGMASLMKSELESNHIGIQISVDGNLFIRCDHTLIGQVMINLITNSIHALEDTRDKTIHIKAYTHEQHHVIEVKDNGQGIPEKELTEIFVPFFSTKSNGSGIGLSLSKQIMSQHGGNIKVASQPGVGTSFYLQFKK